MTSIQNGNDREEFINLIRSLGFIFEKTVVCCGGRRSHIYQHPTGLKIKLRSSVAALMLKNRVLAPAMQLKKIHDESERKKIESVVAEKISERAAQ